VKTFTGGFPMNRDFFYLKKAAAEAYKCEIDISDGSDNKFSVGCVIVIGDRIISRGFTGEKPYNTHAEECAVIKASKAGINLRYATLYTTMEPCSVRLFTGEKSCTDIIIESGIRRVVYGAREPPLYVNCIGHSKLESAGVEVLHLKEMEKECLESCMRFHCRCL
jgi:pyrimidine deaminase RibD-like protein